MKESPSPSNRERLVHAETAALASTVVGWRSLLPSIGAHPTIPEYCDPASSAVAAALAGWPAHHQAMIAARQNAAEAFVTAAAATSAAFNIADNHHAAMISACVERV